MSRRTPAEPGPRPGCRYRLETVIVAATTGWASLVFHRDPQKRAAPSGTTWPAADRTGEPSGSYDTDPERWASRDPTWRIAEDVHDVVARTVVARRLRPVLDVGSRRGRLRDVLPGGRASREAA